MISSTRVLLLILLLVVPASVTVGQRPVKLARVLDGGIQPQIAVDEHGTVHLVYFKGDPTGGDLFYVRRHRGDAAFSDPIQVNGRPGSAVAAGTIRGAQVATGAERRLHVVWNGSSKVQSDDGAVPLLYTRLNDSGSAFEPERDVITWATGLDGGGSVAADRHGNVYVVWHAGPHGAPEDERAVYIAHSSDGGQTFERERHVSPESTGACGCCGLRAFADEEGGVYVIYRGASNGIQRDMHLLVSENRGRQFDHARLDPWELFACPMSSAAIANSDGKIMAGWQTKEQVYFSDVTSIGAHSKPVAPPGEARARKHPAIAARADGLMLLAWTEGMGWAQGGSLAWQVYDATGKPEPVSGRAEGVPVWSMPAAYVDHEGDFVVMY
jgi:hypothetical protein